jgi:transcriptional regulator with GAF, ATPase, and Fis domain
MQADNMVALGRLEIADTADFWFKYHGDSGLIPHDLFVRSIRDHGIRLYPHADGNPRKAGVFLFDRFDLEMLASLRQCCRDAMHRVIAVFIGSKGISAATGLEIMSVGAGDILAWNSMEDPGKSIAARLKRWSRVDMALNCAWVRAHLAGSSPAWIGALRQLAEAALFSQSPILLTGETGTGKELLSRLIHFLAPNPQQKSLTVLDCTTVVPGLSGSEFFGHEKGAFTHAIANREGAFAMADGGTLFLDEIGELPFSMQSELLRVIQERTFKKVGGQDWKTVEFRLVSATNRDLGREVEKGRFRKDLYHRLAGWIINIPSLKERCEDILPLAEFFALEAAGKCAGAVFEPSVQEYLLSREYPGNIRELRQLVHAMVMRSGGCGPIGIGDIPRHAMHLSKSQLDRISVPSARFESAVRLALLNGMTLREITREVAASAVELALKTEGSMQGAAERLGVCKRTLELRRIGMRQCVGEQ